jgi:Flp pilus assembly pilin Flp
VPRHAFDAETGQAAAEYVLIAAAVAIGCAMAVLFFGGAVTNLFGTSAKPIKTAPFRPPVRSGDITFPTTVAECVDGGWRNFPQFADEAACADYVASLAP